MNKLMALKNVKEIKIQLDNIIMDKYNSNEKRVMYACLDELKEILK